MMNAIAASVHEPSYCHLRTRFEPEYGILWYHMDPKPRPCITMELLKDVRRCQLFIERVDQAAGANHGDCPIRYGVLASKSDGVYSLGGDLKLFVKLITEKDTDGLRDYARACIDTVFANYTMSLSVPVTTISLVQGDALGGGFEAALSSNVIIAEKRSRFGFPEVLFNLFPGMGAYSLLSRRLDARRAETMILGGNICSAEELHELGIVDVVAEDGDGEKAVYDFVSKHSRKRNTYQSFHRVRQTFNPISHGELMDAANIWVEAALTLGSKDLRLMDRLVKAQEKLPGGSPVAERIGEEEYA